MPFQVNEAVVIGALDGSKYLGIPDKEYPCEDAIRLKQARKLMAEYTQHRSQDGQSMGFALSAALFPIDLATGPIDIEVCPMTTYRLSDNPDMQKKFERLVAGAEDNEARMRAQEAGIQLAR
jgi:hypothetical protein